MPSDLKRVSRALLSVSDKSGLVDFARALSGRGVELGDPGGQRRLGAPRIAGEDGGADRERRSHSRRRNWQEPEGAGS